MSEPYRIPGGEQVFCTEHEHSEPVALTRYQAAQQHAPSCPFCHGTCARYAFMWCDEYQAAQIAKSGDDRG